MAICNLNVWCLRCHLVLFILPKQSKAIQKKIKVNCDFSFQYFFPHNSEKENSDIKSEFRVLIYFLQFYILQFQKCSLNSQFTSHNSDFFLWIPNFPHKIKHFIATVYLTIQICFMILRKNIFERKLTIRKEPPSLFTVAISKNNGALTLHIFSRSEKIQQQQIRLRTFSFQFFLIFIEIQTINIVVWFFNDRSLHC